MAQRIADLPASQIVVATVNFTFPAYSKIQHEKERLGKSFLDIFETLTSLVLPLTVFVFFAAPDIVYGLLGEKWENSIIPLKLLSVAGFFIAMDVMLTPLFISVGKPNVEFWKNLLKVCIMAITIYPLTALWGLSGTCLSLIFSSIAVSPIWAKARSMANIRWSDLFLRLLSPLVLGLTTILAVILAHTFYYTSFLSLVIAVIASGLFYVSASIIIGRTFKRGIYMLIPRIFKNL